jgi:uncharacterized membrane protein
MSIHETQSQSAERYLSELNAALSSTPASLRSEILRDIADELRGLDEAAASERIAKLGDPLAIAADANAEFDAPAPTAAPLPTPTGTTATEPSLAYPTTTAIVLTAGWYLVPVLGWIAGLVMIGVGREWTRSVRVRAIVASGIIGLISLGALLVFRGTDFWGIGLGTFVVLPLIANICVGSYIRRRWSQSPLTK